MAEGGFDGADAGSVPAVIDTAADLGRELKHWARHGAKGPVKVAALARRLRTSQSTLYAYLAGTTLPPTEVLDDLLHELGVPADERRRLSTARDAVQRRRSAVRPPPGVAHRRVPYELPAAPAGFVGRTEELAALDEALPDPADAAAGIPVALISGTAGLGKTALAVHWGHRVADRFPDGCLYVDLLGYSPVEHRSPADVLAGFLRSLGLDDVDIPNDEHERAARYRSMLAGQRMLIVLDNALDVDQVRSLLPGSATCFVVITSRADLTGLQVWPGARPIDLRPLTHDDGLGLLRTHVGTRVDEFTAAAGVLAERCGGLPLALRIVAAQAASRPEQSLDELVAELAAGQGLDAFDVGEPATAVRTVFSWSDRHLPGRAAELFRVLGLLPVRDVDTYAVAAMLGTDVRTAGRRLGLLIRAHLVQRSGRGRFRMHDLVREYAWELALDEMPQSDQDAVLTRIVDYFVGVGATAMNVLHPSDAPTGTRAVEPAEMPSVRTPADALEWLDAEWQNLLATISFTAKQQWPGATARLAAVLQRHLDQGGRHSDSLTIAGHALAASRLSGDRAAESVALHQLGVAQLRLGRHRQAMEYHQRALTICRESGDSMGEAGTLNNLGNLYERLGRYAEAMEQYRHALPLARELGLRQGEATLLTNLGVVHTRLGDYEQAMRDCHSALEAFTQVGDAGGTARTLGNLGEIHRLAGRYEQSLELCDRALGLAREIGARGIETEVLNHLGEMHLDTGAFDRSRERHESALAVAKDIDDRYEEARALVGIGCVLEASGHPDLADMPWQEALTVYRQLGLPEARRVRALLARVAGPGR